MIFKWVGLYIYSADKNISEYRYLITFNQHIVFYTIAIIYHPEKQKFVLDMVNRSDPLVTVLKFNSLIVRPTCMFEAFNIGVPPCRYYCY